MRAMEPPNETRTLPTLRGARVTLRSGRADDSPALRAVFDAPEVAHWWPTPSEDELDEMLANGDPDVDVWLVELDGRVVGLIQASEEQDPMYRHAGIDIVLHPDVHGRGVGPEAIRVLARHLFEDRGHHRIVIDPNAANERAIRAYEKVGFRQVGVLREYEHHADRGWTDGVLMDLLRREFVDGSVVAEGMGGASGGKQPSSTARPFLDPQSAPEAEAVQRVLGAASSYYRDLLVRTAGFTPSWTYTKGSGWLLKLAAKGKVLCYVVPLVGSFRVSMAIREAERDHLLEAPGMVAFAPLVRAARKAPEGFAIVFDVNGDDAYDRCRRFIDWVVEARAAL